MTHILIVDDATDDELADIAAEQRELAMQRHPAGPQAPVSWPRRAWTSLRLLAWTW